MKKSYRFTFDMDSHGDVVKIIESVPKTLRSQYLVEIIRFAHSRLFECTSSGTLPTNDTPPKEQSEKINLSKIFSGL